MTPDTNEKTLVLYHGNCPDGITAAWVAWKEFYEKAEYVPIGYSDKLPMDINKYSVIYFLDYFPTDSQIKKIPHHSRVTIIDHHASNRDRVKSIRSQVKYTVVFDLEHSGCVLSWQHFNSGKEVPIALRYVEDRDLWRWDLPESKAWNVAFYNTVDWDFRKINTVFIDMKYESFLDAFIEKGRTCLQVQNRLIDDMVKNARPAILKNGVRAIVVNTVCLGSDVSNKLLELYPDYNYAGYWFDRGDRLRQWGLRSRSPEYDCSEIAKAHGGGGHPCAAGWEQPI